MVDARQRPKRIKSLPLRKCGLKLPYWRLRIGWSAVTSLAEVWIEICICLPESNTADVTSLAEVWIEIKTVSYLIRPFSSLPLRKCGLKWSGSAGYPPRDPSLPLRKCGLKWWMQDKDRKELSHFPCGSVDWNLCGKNAPVHYAVTSLAEVWIEIYIYCDSTFPWHGHFPCGSVDWNTTACWRDSTPDTSLPLRKCGLK